MKEVTLASPDFRQMDPKGGRLLILSGVAAMMDEKELREEMKRLIDEQGLGKSEEKQQRRHDEIAYRPARKHFRLDRALGYMFFGPMLLVAIVVGGIMLYSALA